MTERLGTMQCFLLAGGNRDRDQHFTVGAEEHALDKGYRKYAKVFDRVTLVLNKDQAKERYLNYPHVCDEHDDDHPTVGIVTALENAQQDYVFIGSDEIVEFSPEMIVDLIREYDGEEFLGYGEPDGGQQPLFGIYHKQMLPKLKTIVDSDDDALTSLLAETGRIMPLPEGKDIDQLAV